MLSSNKLQKYFFNNIENLSRDVFIYQKTFNQVIQHYHGVIDKIITRKNSYKKKYDTLQHNNKNYEENLKIKINTLKEENKILSEKFENIDYTRYTNKIRKYKKLYKNYHDKNFALELKLIGSGSEANTIKKEISYVNNYLQNIENFDELLTNESLLYTGSLLNNINDFFKKTKIVVPPKNNFENDNLFQESNRNFIMNLNKKEESMRLNMHKLKGNFLEKAKDNYQKLVEQKSGIEKLLQDIEKYTNTEKDKLIYDFISEIKYNLKTDRGTENSNILKKSLENYVSKELYNKMESDLKQEVNNLLLKVNDVETELKNKIEKDTFNYNDYERIKKNYNDLENNVKFYKDNYKILLNKYESLVLENNKIMDNHLGLRNLFEKKLNDYKEKCDEEIINSKINLNKKQIELDYKSNELRRKEEQIEEEKESFNKKMQIEENKRNKNEGEIQVYDKHLYKLKEENKLLKDYTKNLETRKNIYIDSLQNKFMLVDQLKEEKIIKNSEDKEFRGFLNEYYLYKKYKKGIFSKDRKILHNHLTCANCLKEEKIKYFGYIIENNLVNFLKNIGLNGIQFFDYKKCCDEVKLIHLKVLHQYHKIMPSKSIIWYRNQIAGTTFKMNIHERFYRTYLDSKVNFKKKCQINLNEFLSMKDSDRRKKFISYYKMLDKEINTKLHQGVLNKVEINQNAHKRNIKNDEICRRFIAKKTEIKYSDIINDFYDQTEKVFKREKPENYNLIGVLKSIFNKSDINIKKKKYYSIIALEKSLEKKQKEIIELDYAKYLDRDKNISIEEV